MIPGSRLFFTTCEKFTDNISITASLHEKFTKNLHLTPLSIHDDPNDRCGNLNGDKYEQIVNTFSKKGDFLSHFTTKCPKMRQGNLHKTQKFVIVNACHIQIINTSFLHFLLMKK